jgi:C-terminal processing protease CtpA/Prc
VLAAAGGAKKKKLTVPVASRKPIHGEWPRTRSRVLDGNVGYLRIAEMDDAPEFLAAIEDSMASFRSTKGLVIDVRGNGGGSRVALRALFPHFMKEGDAPRIANVAKFRVPPGEERGRPGGYLEDRFLFPLASPGWSASERAAIEAFSASFEPEWTPDPARFSDWHYFVLGPRPRGSGRDEKKAYDRKVAVLLDGDCFSATDVFLGAFKGWRNVTLVGTPSGGGSGRARGVELEKSGIRVRLSSMASFRRDGKLYDRNGVEPDVVVPPAPTDFIVGGTDTILEAALRLLR